MVGDLFGLSIATGMVSKLDKRPKAYWQVGGGR
jgi:hypothetical protein